VNEPQPERAWQLEVGSESEWDRSFGKGKGNNPESESLQVDNKKKHE
jgi:hypothetical protein